MDAGDDRRHDAAAKETGARILFSCGFNSIPFELGVFFVQEEAKLVFGAPASRVKGRVRDMRGTFSGGTAASGPRDFEAAAARIPAWCDAHDPFALTPGLQRAETAAGQQARL